MGFYNISCIKLDVEIVIRYLQFILTILL